MIIKNTSVLHYFLVIMTVVSRGIQKWVDMPYKYILSLLSMRFLCKLEHITCRPVVVVF